MAAIPDSCPTSLDAEPDLAAVVDSLLRDSNTPLAEARRANLVVTPLTDGRTGSRLRRIHEPGTRRSVVIKRVPRERGLAQGMGTVAGGEGPLWKAGVTGRLPSPLACPMLDARYDAEQGAWWLVLADVSHGIVGRGAWTEGHSRRLFEGLARLHAAYWDREATLNRLPLAGLDGTTRVMAEPVRVLGRNVPAEEPWVERVLDEFPVPRVLLPVFLEALGPMEADAYLTLVEGWRDWLPLLADHPPTLLHGDLRRANIAFDGNRVILFDWELATRGPAPCDLQWHLFLHYWAYPPAGNRRPPEEPTEALRALYLERLEAALERRIDRAAFARAWDLAWLRVLVQLGYCLADPLTEPSCDADEYRRVTALCRRTVAHARAVRDRSGV